MNRQKVDADAMFEDDGCSGEARAIICHHSRAREGLHCMQGLLVEPTGAPRARAAARRSGWKQSSDPGPESATIVTNAAAEVDSEAAVHRKTWGDYVPIVPTIRSLYRRMNNAIRIIRIATSTAITDIETTKARQNRASRV